MVLDQLHAAYPQWLIFWLGTPTSEPRAKPVVYQSISADSDVGGLEKNCFLRLKHDCCSTLPFYTLDQEYFLAQPWQEYMLIDLKLVSTSGAHEDYSYRRDFDHPDVS